MDTAFSLAEQREDHQPPLSAEHNRENRSMTQSRLITVLTFFLLVGQLSCLATGERQAARPSVATLNPYRGTVKNLLQTKVGDYELLRTARFDEIAEEVNNPTDIVGAIYSAPNQQNVQHMLAIFPSMRDANNELDKALDRYRDAHVSMRIEQLRDPYGNPSGRRIIVNDLNTEAMNWTNGSLYCTVVSYTGRATAFAKDLPY
jgi:hypothetical protein